MKKQNFISLLLKAKILLSVMMVVVLVCSMSFEISAANAATGYATANATVFTPMDLLETTMGSSTVSKSLTLKDSLDNSVWKFAVNGTVLTTTNSVITNRYYLDSYIEFTSSDASSKYDFYGSTNSYDGTRFNYTVRTIKFTVANGEKMTFGFTAPTAGAYEISAPISATGTNVKYAVYKTNANGRICLQDWQDYTAAGVFCNLITSLAVGETIWLEATADEGSVIDIGIPRVIKHTEDKGVTDNGDGSLTYNYCAMDYFELATANGLSYGTFSAPSNTTGAWKYGYFKDTVTFGKMAKNFTSALGLEAGEMKLDTTRSSTLKDELLAALKSYELIPYGDRYAAYDTSSDQAPKDVLGGSNAVVGVASGIMIPDIANNTFTSNFRASDADQLSTSYTQYGNWFEFTTPVSGTVRLLYPVATNLDSNFVMLVALNNKIVYRTVTTASEITLNLGTLSVGDRVTVLYYSFKDRTSATLTLPTVSLTGTYNTLTLNANGGEDSHQKYVSSGTAVTLPIPTKDGYSFLNWSDGTNTYNGGDTYKVSDNATLTANYQALSSTVNYDLDGDYDVDADDLVIMRKYLLGLDIIAGDRLPFADKNDKAGIDIRDLVHMIGLITTAS